MREIDLLEVVGSKIDGRYRWEVGEGYFLELIRSKGNLTQLWEGG